MTGENQHRELTDFVTDPAARRELARRIEEIADLVGEADDILGEILHGVRRDE
ncbi:hypothetical protein [Streptomyces cavernae]|uniref:hypothetical protein n=1 Tax=Streptomyces cavernae TaxID=2259034 RepID=UPI0012D991AE|nr:hypothetical protein [Streptomyces cavernae]